MVFKNVSAKHHNIAWCDMYESLKTNKHKIKTSTIDKGVSYV